MGQSNCQHQADVSIREGEIYFSEPKTAKGRRILEVEPEVLADLKRQKAQQAEERLKPARFWQDNNLVFTKEDGAPITQTYFLDAFGAC
jgi:integrase